MMNELNKFNKIEGDQGTGHPTSPPLIKNDPNIEVLDNICFTLYL